MASAPQLVVECRGCGTQHHAVCLAELGRCTVLGCEEPEGQELPDGLDDLQGMSEIAQAIRKRARSRARNFVRRNAKPLGDVDLLARRRAFEEDVSRWLPEVLEVALQNQALYDPEQMQVIKAVAQRRTIRDAPAKFAEVIEAWSEDHLRLGLRSPNRTEAQHKAIRAELRARARERARKRARHRSGE